MLLLLRSLFKNRLIVVDEAHNFGAKTYAKLLDDRFEYRLALSATLERYRDEEGTELLFNFFGEKCIEYSLERAINEDKLTKYLYKPIVVYLTESELQAYEKISREISRCYIKTKDNKRKLNKQGEYLAIKRARIIAGASNKLDALKREIVRYKNKKNILVYCGATNILPDKSDSTEIDDDDLRQISVVTRMLGNDLGMKVTQFTSNETTSERKAIREAFVAGDMLQAIIAIKCLDEGVNIPGIVTAFILASSTNPKEYIQRRGRVLRKAPNKERAEIYDFITLPRPLDEISSLTEEQVARERSLVRNEVKRIKEFGRLSDNPLDAQQLIYNIENVFGIITDEQEE